MGVTAEGMFNFGGLTGEQMLPGKERFSVIPVPYDLTASYISGMRNGPRAIIEASTHMELYDEELGCEPFEAGIRTLPFIEATALGPAEMIKKVRAGVAAALADGTMPVTLGGEHSISLGAVEALLDRYPDLSVLQLDAHADMRDEYQETPFNHACVARRISELCPVVQAGIRSLSVEEAEFLAGKEGKKRVKTYYAREVLKGGAWRKVLRDLKGPVYITVDLDVFDPAVMPATGTPEPGGLYWYDVTDLLRSVIMERSVVGFDVVELCPLPGNVASDFLAAKLVYKMMGYVNKARSAGRAGKRTKQRPEVR